jgi:NADH-quinone oxidoreductase subunit I
MYCGICVEVCPFDALFWAPDFEYAEYDIVEMTHEKERLEEWTYKVLPPPPLEDGAEPPAEAEAEAPAEVGAASPPAQPPAAQAAAAVPPQTPETPAGSAPAAAPAPPRPAAAAPEHVEPDQETYDRVLAEEVAKGTDRRVAEGRARAAGIRAARKKAEG